MTRTEVMRLRWALPAVIVVLAAVFFAGRVVAGQFRGDDPRAFQADLAGGTPIRLADIAAADGHAGRGVFATVTDMGQFCLWDAVSARSPQRQGGCNSASDPLGGSVLSASLAFEGGPALETVRDARLIGLVTPKVARVELLMSDGTQRSMRLKQAKVGAGEFLAFGYRVKHSDLGQGVGPVAVIARDASGNELARQPTGIGN